MRSRIDGKNFRYSGTTYSSKSAADEVAHHYRNRGHLARVIRKKKEYNVWEVYFRKR